MLTLCLALLLGQSTTDSWEAAPAAFDKGGHLPKVVIAKDGKVTLENRGMLNSKKEFGPATVSFKWQWTEGDVRLYEDHLTVALRSNGVQKARPYEIDEGLIVRFNPTGKRITIEEVKQGLPAQEAGRKADITFDKAVTYTVVIEDRGKEIVVKVDGKEVLKTKVDEGSGKVAIYNREPVANVRHVSEISDLKIVPAKKK